MNRVEGKVALITGAARGQGRSHAVRLAQEGADIIAIDACAQMETVPYAAGTIEDLEETAELVRREGRKVHTAVADVRDMTAMAEAVDAGVQALGQLDILVANAGIFSVASEGELDERTWREMIDVNLTGVWITTKAGIPHIVSGHSGGSITLISSIAGLKGMSNFAHYVAAKHGVVGLMRTLSNELAEHNIRVNSIHPTNVDTPMIQNTTTRRLFVDKPEPTREEFAESAKWMNTLTVPWVDPVDISNAVLFLSSDEARYITGVTLPVDAGYSSKS
ncbi:mycofactocin-coupled SDR family oxidoreductase [Rhodococcus sp. T2V]|uniref:mycofactocin-coupled SDR family oxidoreductase n=1 Tax=Rhodococcus sp. T2V TaxID=3034164 RepID=UPI0023E18E7D|nr:mycofactocin-coupled SDR family oxidoreductase [Rhodococcus sp. T2V]MDF3306454.1 mycofactocin-coupled SDR family oxidoreductase [Rhodococcus sp. T2V]